MPPPIVNMGGHRFFLEPPLPRQMVDSRFYDAEIIGLNALVADLAAVQALTPVLTSMVVKGTADLMAALARTIHTPHILTRSTWTTTNADHDVTRNLYDFSIEWGTGTRQGRLLEWGFRHFPDGRFIQYPFIMPATDALEPTFIESMVRVADILANQVRQPPLLGSSTTAAQGAAIQQYRGFLYSASKALGDVQVVAQSPLIGRARTLSLAGARLLGDVDAVMNDAISTRVIQRVAGRAAGFAVAGGRSFVLQGSVGDLGAQRIYNRTIGRAIGTLGLRAFD